MPSLHIPPTSFCLSVCVPSHSPALSLETFVSFLSSSFFPIAFSHCHLYSHNSSLCICLSVSSILLPPYSLFHLLSFLRLLKAICTSLALHLFLPHEGYSSKNSIRNHDQRLESHRSIILKCHRISRRFRFGNKSPRTPWEKNQA